MRKVAIGFITIIMVIMLCGCGNKKVEEKVVKCMLSNNDVTNGYEVKSEYNITTNGELVRKVDTVEKVTSSNASVLSYFQVNLINTYAKFKQNYGGCTYDVTKDGNTVTSEVTMDYSKADLKKASEDDASIKSILNDDYKVTLDGIISMYEGMGATCEK